MSKLKPYTSVQGVKYDKARVKYESLPVGALFYRSPRDGAGSERKRTNGRLRNAGLFHGWQEYVFVDMGGSYSNELGGLIEKGLKNTREEVENE